MSSINELRTLSFAQELEFKVADLKGGTIEKQSFHHSRHASSISGFGFWVHVFVVISLHICAFYRAACLCAFLEPRTEVAIAAQSGPETEHWQNPKLHRKVEQNQPG